MAKKPSIILYGAGGHGKVIADMVEKEGRCVVAGFIDDTATGEMFGIPVLGGKSVISSLKKKGVDGAVVSIGSGKARSALQKELRNAGLMIMTVCHPSAQIARGASLGDGTVVMPGAVVGPDAVIGESSIINTSASVDHDCILGEFVHVAPGAHLAGGVHVGKFTHIGIGSAVKEGVTIGKNVIVGAGSVVIDDLPDGCTAYGVPAKPQV